MAVKPGYDTYANRKDRPSQKKKDKVCKDCSKPLANNFKTYCDDCAHTRFLAGKAEQNKKRRKR